MTINIFDDQFKFISQSLNLRAKRNTILASNIANRETPGYRAQDLVFEKELKQALHSQEEGSLRRTNERHYSGIPPKDLEQVNGDIIKTYNEDPGMDGNTVDLDKEMTKLAENQLLYKANITALNWKLRLLKLSIQEGGK